jgi:hypothetical protein
LLTTWLCSGGHGVTSEMRSPYPRSFGPTQGLAWLLLWFCSETLIRYLQAIQILKDLDISSSIPTNLSPYQRYLQKNQYLWTIWWQPFPP